VQEGRQLPYVARQAGHSVEECSRTYTHLFEEFEGAPAVPAEELIRRARAQAEEAVSGPDVRSEFGNRARETEGGADLLAGKWARCRPFAVKPSAGLEPATPSLPWKCSTN
jgi:hypothetical protein